MMILGLTGSIGMGKSTVASQFALHGAHVFDADQCVHQMLAKDGIAVDIVAEFFPEAHKAGAIDRTKLGEIVYRDEMQLDTLEAILHPMVQAARAQFTKLMRRKGVDFLVFDIPLLFETGAEAECDAVAVVTAPLAVQRRRALERGGMTAKRFAQINALQMPIAEKELRADYVIRNGLNKAAVAQQVKHIVKDLRCQFAKYH